MKKIILILASFVFLTGCSSKEQSPLSKTENDFQSICNEYKEYINEKIKKDDYDGQGTFGVIDYEKYQSNLIDIFYSPKLNTCIAHYFDFSHLTGFNDFSGKINQKETYETLFDIFANEKITRSVIESTIHDEKFIQWSKEYFQKRITELNNPDEQNYEVFIGKHNQKQLELREEQKELAINKESIFRKNQECAKWIPKIKQRMEEFKEKRTNEVTAWDPSLQEVFYSPKTNSCLYIDHVQRGEDRPFTMKRLVDVSQDVAVDPVDDMSCQFISNSVAYDELRNYTIENEDEYALKVFDASMPDCKGFDRKIREEYKVLKQP